MFTNLKAEMVRSKISIKDLAVFLGVTYATAHRKLNGQIDFSIEEFMKIKNEMFKGEFSYDYLFE